MGRASFARVYYHNRIHQWFAVFFETNSTFSFSKNTISRFPRLKSVQKTPIKNQFNRQGDYRIEFVYRAFDTLRLVFCQVPKNRAFQRFKSSRTFHPLLFCCNPKLLKPT